MKSLRYNRYYAFAALCALAFQFAYGFGHTHNHHPQSQGSAHASHDHHDHLCHHRDHSNGHADLDAVEHDGEHDDGEHDEHECPTCWTLSVLAGLAEPTHHFTLSAPTLARFEQKAQNDPRVDDLSGRNYHARAPPVTDLIVT